jgi:hypothetical protein
MNSPVADYFELRFGGGINAFWSFVHICRLSEEVGSYYEYY